MTATPQEVYDLLFAAYGPQHWWPGETPFEVLVGAVLTQNTAWKNVERAIANLRDAGVLSPSALYALSTDELGELIRPAGYFRVKAVRLRNLLRLVVEKYEGSLDAMFATGLDSLREELLSINGIGPETADAILLYAGNLPTFVIDAYTARVLKRHGWIEPEADYYAMKEYFESSLPREEQLFNEYHALIVQVGKQHCSRTAKCAGCPLEALLPEGGIEYEGCNC
jgi:endonuclease-3 related protein